MPGVHAFKLCAISNGEWSVHPAFPSEADAGGVVNNVVRVSPLDAAGLVNPDNRCV